MDIRMQVSSTANPAAKIPFIVTFKGQAHHPPLETKYGRPRLASTTACHVFRTDGIGPLYEGTSSRCVNDRPDIVHGCMLAMSRATARMPRAERAELLAKVVAQLQREPAVLRQRKLQRESRLARKLRDADERAVFASCVLALGVREAVRLYVGSTKRRDRQ